MSKTEKAGLLKSFGLKMAIIIVMSSIIGSGVFKKVAPMAEGLLDPWLVILAWGLAGIIILFGVMSIAELGALFPESGGPYAWLEKVYGKVVAYLYGWTCFTVIQTAAISSIAFIFAGALNTFIALPHLSPQLESITIFGIIQPFNNMGAKMVSILLIIFVTWVNIRGAKQGGFLSLIFTYIIGASIIIISILAFNSTIGSWETMDTRSVNYPVGGFTFLGFLGVMVIAMRNAFWGFEGWIALGFIGEELKNARKNLPKAMIIGILLITALYLLINTGYLYVLPIDEMISKMNADENNIAAVLVMDKIFGDAGAYIISAMILVSTFGCTNATTLVSSRIYYAMAQKGLFFKAAGQTHKKGHTPHKSLIYQCIWACILVLSGSFSLLTDLVIIAAFVFYGLVVFGVVILRIRNPKSERPYKTPGYPFVPIIFTLFCIVLLVISFVESPSKSIIGSVLIFSGLPFYFYFRWKYKADKALVKS